jgi:hypothetical protein
MEKLSLDSFLEFMKDPESNTENFKSWGLYPNEEPETAKDFNFGTSKKGNVSNGSDAYTY